MFTNCIISPTVQRNFMVAMYVIFLGIIPSILLILFLIYYSRHNVLLWWKKPRKSYVNILLCCGCCGCSNSKTKFSDKFARFQTSTNSLRQLLSLKRNDSVNPNVYTDPPAPDSPIYATIEETKPPKKPPYKFVNSQNKSQKKAPLTKPARKINKDDIQIANNSDFKLRPPVKPKPGNNLSSENKPNVVIVKGLESTTNEMVTNDQHRMYNIRSSGLYNNVAGQNIKVHVFKK